jgi:hypothetical protein
MSIKKSNTNKKASELSRNNEHDGSYKQIFSHPEMVESPCVREIVASSEIHLRGPEG